LLSSYRGDGRPADNQRSWSTAICAQQGVDASKGHHPSSITVICYTQRRTKETASEFG
jgi:hypothetical protein